MESTFSCPVSQGVSALINTDIIAVHQAPQEIQEFLAWQQDLESESKSPTTQARPTVFRWAGVAKEVFVSGSFNNWATKIPLNRRYFDSFGRIFDLSVLVTSLTVVSQTQSEKLCGYRGPAGGGAPVQVLCRRSVDVGSHRGEWKQIILLKKNFKNT